MSSTLNSGVVNNHGPTDSGKNLVWLLDLFLFCRPKFELLPSKLKHLVIKRAEFRLNSVKIPCDYHERVLKPELALAFCQGGILAQHWMGKERLWPKF